MLVMKRLLLQMIRQVLVETQLSSYIATGLVLCVLMMSDLMMKFDITREGWTGR
jgi:dUTPase